jgi:carbohydrate-binding DOMON domain-containing protein
MSNGITAPPEIAIIINPEISFFRAGYFSTAIENTSGQMLATARPIMNTNPQAIKVDLTRRIDTKQIIPRADDPRKNLRDEILVNSRAPPKVPSIRPKK